MAGTPMAPDMVRPVHSSICASRSHVHRTAADTRVAVQADMAATVLHRRATADRTEHQTTVVLVEHLVTAEVVAMVVEEVMLQVVDIQVVAEVDTPALAGVDTQVAAVVDIPAAAAAIPAVIANTARRCGQRLAKAMS